MNLFWKALTAFLLLPGIVAFVVPSMLRPAGAQFRPAGLPLLIVGLTVLLSCVRDFYVAGLGSLAPWAPPKHLVVVGLYRWSRNPMYIGVLLILCGWAVAFAARELWMWAAIMTVVFQLRVVLFEEPWLAATHGDQFRRYRARVPRWVIPGLERGGN